MTKRPRGRPKRKQRSKSSGWEARNQTPAPPSPSSLLLYNIIGEDIYSLISRRPAVNCPSGRRDIIDLSIIYLISLFLIFSLSFFLSLVTFFLSFYFFSFLYFFAGI